ncbi:MAG TPA: hypothetical protein VK132_09990 [Gemmatimonadales bacterium]|nr:hypothetical protein [Gemmatimonadales bacterium]
MIAVHAAPPGGDVLGAAYEELRRRVLTGSAFGGAGGLVLLLREGLAAWMARGAAGAAPGEPAVKLERCAALPRVSDGIHAAVVRVLASMILGGGEEPSV